MSITLGSPLEAIQPPLSWWGLTLAAILLTIRFDAVIAAFNGYFLMITRMIIQICGALVLSALLGPTWWNLWAYNGWPDLPVWVGGLLEFLAGEYEWPLQTQMTVTLCTVFSTLILITHLWVALRQPNGMKTRRRNFGTAPDRLKDPSNWVIRSKP